MASGQRGQNIFLGDNGARTLKFLNRSADSRPPKSEATPFVITGTIGKLVHVFKQYFKQYPTRSIGVVEKPGSLAGMFLNVVPYNLATMHKNTLRQPKPICLVILTGSHSFIRYLQKPW
jgi:hypothetical protein